MMSIKHEIAHLRVVLKQTLKDLKYNYWQVKTHAEQSRELDYATLRVYCHMLDKGMNNVNFEKGHSLHYLKSAEELRNRLQNYYGEDRCFKWVNEIIGRFEIAQKEGKPRLYNRAPYDYSCEEKEVITQFIANRTSCRNFKEKEISSDIIKKIVKLAVEAPNACCRQTVRYYVTQDKVIIKEIAPHIAGLTNFTNVQCMVCVAAEVSYYEVWDKNLQYVDASLSAENFILAASLYGIYGTMCNFFHANESDIALSKQLFHVGPTENIIMFIAMGYPIVIPQKPSRRDVDNFYKEI